MSKVYYVGDWAVGCGPLFAETPFNYTWKGLDVYYYGKWLKAALESDGHHQVADVPTWDFYNLAPGAYEDILATHDLLIFSDVEAKNFCQEMVAALAYVMRIIGVSAITDAQIKIPVWTKD